MFALGLAAALLLTLLAALTLLRILSKRPNPNSKLLADLMNSIKDVPKNSNNHPPFTNSADQH